MNRVITLVLVCSGGFAAGSLYAQPAPARHDKAAFVEDTDTFREQLMRRAKGPEWRAPRKTAVMKMDLAGLDTPASLDTFRQAWHAKPISQDLTGCCWVFASTSFFESEIHRLTQRTIKLSEMYTVYWEYVAKARRFVRERGDSVFGRGSEPNATLRIWSQYGIVPAEAYRGLPTGQAFYDDTKLLGEMESYLNTVKERKQWDEEGIIARIRSILDRHMGAPPATVEVDGRRMTPVEYFQQVVRLDPGTYMSLLSFIAEPAHAWCEYKVDDNWWHSKDYYNVSLDEFMKVVKQAVRGGHTLSLAGDDTEPGFCFREGVALIPTFDMGSADIDDGARQLRFTTGSTTDDHAVHLVGCEDRGGQDWYLIKDSSTKAHNSRHPGYMFYHSDYIKLKTMAILLPRDIAESALARTLK